MSRPRHSDEQRQLLLEEIKNRKLLEILHQRRKRLYNRKYRKSFFFISSWAIRLMYIALFLVIVFMDPISNGFREEILQSTKSESYRIYSKKGSYLKTCIDFTTNKSSYSAELINDSSPGLNEGDTVQIERDIFNKPIYFTKNDWEIKYSINSYFDELLFFINLLLCITTLISLSFNDGLYKFNNKVLIFISTNIAISSSIYILARLYYFISG